MTRALKTLRVLLLLSVIIPAVPVAAEMYAVARSATPVLNSPFFSVIFGGPDKRTLKTDRCGQVRELEFIALPGTIFTIRDRLADGTNSILSVETGDYPAPLAHKLYIDSRFVELVQEKPLPRPRQLPSRTDIISSLKQSIGSPYVWGGNMPGGVDEMREMYYSGATGGTFDRHLTLAGLDCSGLLYQATGGWTPRNTSQLVSFGRAVRISGKGAGEIAGLLDPLDLIVWNGHVIMVLDRDTVIESRLECGKPGNGGVKITRLQQRLSEIMQNRRPVNSWPAAGKQRDVFVVRRWYGQ